MISRKERAGNLQEAMITALIGWQSEMWTALPGIVQSVYPNMTCDVQVSIKMKTTSPVDGSVNWIRIPKLLDCPIFFPHGGNCTLTFPVAVGDECLVVFASRCIDSWWQSGGYENNLPDVRMHDLSDGFAFVGFRSAPNVIANISTTQVQLRSDDGAASVAIDPATHTVSITAATLNISGVVNITGDVLTTGALKNNGKDVGSTHRHSGVTVGAGNSGAPI